ncbi:hypothetical protein BJ138DRAFT_1106712 [Hygrophoropsis aurantiaca]|uniref:Uncharacterized protein n=1 Tax=Hygrophoropsis aurantiaca TaxID=72124 RepID=A0ACB7ZV50_9AGAM|nr:hypothetical protein BJ138DRAFT_1106712 [Hygrophoropsis aurantiaca]
MNNFQTVEEFMPHLLDFPASRLQSIARDLADARAKVSLLETEYSKELLGIYATLIQTNGTRDGSSHSHTQSDRDGVPGSGGTSIVYSQELADYIFNHYTNKYNKDPPWDKMTESEINTFKEEFQASRSGEGRGNRYDGDEIAQSTQSIGNLY